MVSDLFFDKKKYISVKDAAKLTNYSKDYIGQLCRHGKVESRRVGRTWYVSEESILSYKDSPATFDFLLNFKKGDRSIGEDNKRTPRANGEIPKILSSNPKIFKVFRFVHEVLFSFDSNFFKPLVPLAAALLLTVGLVSVKNNLLSFSGTVRQLVHSVEDLKNNFTEKGITLSKVSESISSGPSDIYTAMDNVSDFYSSKFSEDSLHLAKVLGDFGESFLGQLSLVSKNPALYIVDSLQNISFAEKKIIDNSISSAVNLISNTHQKVFAFISDSFGGISYTKIYTKNLGDKLSASVSVAISDSLNPVDHAGVVVYNTIQNWFDRTVYSPIALFLKKQPTLVNTVYVSTREKEAKNIPLSGTNSKTVNVVERVVEKSVLSGVSKEELELRLQELNNEILAKLYALSTGTGGSITNVYQEIANSQVINNLEGTTIHNPTITGGSITNTTINTTSSVSFGTTTVTNLIVTNTSTSTFAGSIDLGSGCFSINGTCLSTTGGSGTPGGSDGQVQFNSSGSFAGSSNLVWNNSSGFLGIGTSTPYAPLSVWGGSFGNIFEVVNNSSSTALSVSGTGFGTTTLSGLNISGSATSTSNVGFNITSGCFAVNGNCVSGSSGTGITSLGALGQLQVGASQIFATSTDTTNGLTSALTIISSGNTHTFTPSISGILTVLGGGTGWGAIQANSIVLGNGTNKLSTTSAGTDGQVLALVNGVPTWQATTTLSTISGLLSIAKGGTNSQSFAPNSIITSNADGTALIATSSQLTVGSLISTTTNTSFFLGKLGIGTTTPWGLLSINPTNTLGAANPEFVVGSSTGTHFVVTGSGNVGIGTVNPAYPLEVVSNGDSILQTNRFGSANAAIQILGENVAQVAGGKVYIANTSSEVHVGHSGGDVTIGPNVDPFSNTKLSLMTNDNASTPTKITFAIRASSAQSGNLFELQNNAGNAINVFKTSGQVGIGTSTPQFVLNIASSTKAQLSLSGGNQDSPWVFRSIGNNFYLATSNPLTFATTSTSALSISGSGFGTTTILGLNINGQATSTSNVGFNLTAGCFAIQGTCLSTSASFTNTVANGGTGSTSFAPNSIITSSADGLSLIATSSQLTVGSLISTTTNTSFFLGKLGIGTTTPWGLLSINPTNTLGAANPEFVVGSSTATHLIVNGRGSVGVGTLTPLGKVDVLSNGSGTLTDISTVAANGAYVVNGAYTEDNYYPLVGIRMNDLNPAVINAGMFAQFTDSGSNLALGVSSLYSAGMDAALYIKYNGNVGVNEPNPGADLDVNGVAVLGGVAGVSGQLASSQYPTLGLNSYWNGSAWIAGANGYGGIFQFNNAGGDLTYYTGTNVSALGTHNNTAAMTILRNGFVGISTTTPVYNLTVASTTGSQLALSAGGGLAQWAFRNAGGNLYLSTTTVAGTATTSTSALSISGSGFGTTTILGLNINGQATSTSNVGYSLSGGCFAILGNCLSLTNLGGVLTQGSGGTGLNTYAAGDIIYADLSGNLTRLAATSDTLVLKLIGGVPSWQTDLTSGGGGGATAWSTTSNNMIIYPTDTSDIVVLGSNATTTTGNIFEVVGNSLFGGNIKVTGNSSTTLFSAYTAWFGGTATTTFNNNGTVGVSSTTPFGRLSVNPIAGDTIGFVVGSSTATQLSVSSIGFGTTTLSGLNISGSATSTSNVGFNLTAGCFAIAGSCLSSSSSFSNTVANGGTGSSSFAPNSIITSNADGTALIATSSQLTVGSLLSTTTNASSFAGALTVSGLLSTTYSSTTYASFVSASTTNLIVKGSSFNSLLGSGLSNSAGALTVSGLTTSNLTSANVSQFTNDANYAAFPFTVNTGYNSTTSTIGFINGGLFSTASSTFSSSLYLPSLTQGFVYTGTSGKVNTIASSSVQLSWFTNDSGFITNTGTYAANSIITTNSAGNLIATSSQLTVGSLISTTTNYSYFSGALGIGATTTVGSILAVSSTTQSQLALIGNNTDNIWRLRSIGNNFYISTSTATSQATSSISSLEISNTGTTTLRGLNISALATSTSNVGYNISAGCFAISGSCLSHSNLGGQVSLTTQVSGVLPVSSGGTNSQSFAPNSIITSSADGLSLIATSSQLTVGSLISTTTNKSYFLGNIGIGTSTPYSTSLLTLYTTGSTAATSPQLVFSASSTVANPLYNKFLYNWAVGTDIADGGKFKISSSSVVGTNDRFVIDGNGNVGIAITSPTQKLDVVGFVNVDKASGYKQAGNTILFASSTLHSIFAGVGAGTGLITNATSSDLTSGADSTALGYNALNSNTNTGYYNTAIGSQTLTANTTGFDNTAIGAFVLIANTTGHDNFAAGEATMNSNTTGSSNVANGTNALFSNKTGDSNIAIGQQSMFDNITGSNNVGIGTQSLWANTSATNTVAIGFQAGAGNFAAYHNQGSTYVGYASGYTSQTSSDYNTFLGYQSGYSLTTGAYNIAIGQNIDLPSNSANQQLNIGNILYGRGLYNGGSMSSTPTPDGRIGIGTTTPYYALTIASTTGSQLALSASTGIAQWAFRNAGGNLYLSTTTVAGTATTSISALEVAGGGFGTTTIRGLNIVGLATSTSNVGYNITTGCFAISGTCLSSFSNTVANGGTGSSSFAPNSIITSSADGLSLIATSSQLTVGSLISTTTNTSFFLGKLGIGTTTPPSLLTIGPTTAQLISSNPLLLIGTSTLIAASANGTYAGINAPTGFTGNFLDFQLSGSSKLMVDYLGDVIAAADFFGTGLSNVSSGNNAYVRVPSTGTVISRNIADTNPSLVVKQTNVGSTGDILQLQNYADTILSVQQKGQVGIGTTTPRFVLNVASSTKAQLALSGGNQDSPWVFRSIGNNFYLSTSSPLTFATTSISALEIAGSGFGTTTIRGLNISGFATSTSNVGFNLTAGCFAINGSCLSASTGVASGMEIGGSITSATEGSVLFVGPSGVLAQNNSKFFWNNSTERLGIGAAPGSYVLDIQAGVGTMHVQSTDGTNPVYGIYENDGGKLTIGRESSVSGSGILTGDTAYASVINSEGVYPLQFGVNGIVAMTVTSAGFVGIGTTSPSAGLHVSGSSADGFNTIFITASDNANIAKGGIQWTTSDLSNKSSILSGQFVNDNDLELITGNGNSAVIINSSGHVGIGTTTPYYGLTIASTTRSQLSLSAGGGIAQWAFRNAGGNFYLSTTTVVGTATTSISALEISGGGFGTTTIRGLNIVGLATSTSNVGYNITTGCFAISGTCLSSFSNTVANGGTGSTSFAPNSIITSSADGLSLIATSSQLTVGSLISTTTNTSFFLGKLGIGTTTPWGLLSVNPTNTLGAANPEFVVGSSTATHFIVTGSGSVGIGTLTPYSALDIASVGAAITLGDAGVGGKLQFRDTNNRIEYGASELGIYTNQTNGLNFYTNGANARMRIDNNGNIGIGTTSPYALLTLYKAGATAAASPQLVFSASSTAYTGTNSYLNNWAIGTDLADGGKFKISSSSVIGTNDRFVIDGKGNVGIGTANPMDTLDVNKNFISGMGGRLLINNQAARGPGSGVDLAFKTSVDYSDTYYSNRIASIDMLGTTLTDLVFYAYDGGLASGTEKMRIRNNGNIAIGTSTTPGIGLLTLASTTNSQLALSAGTGIAQWVQRNAGGNFYLSTTTVAGTATTSISALEIAGGGFGTTTVRGLNIVGLATSTSNVGYNITSGCFAIAGSCLSSSSSFSNTVANGGTGSSSFAPNSIITSNADGTALIATSSQLTVGSLISTTTNNSYFLGSLGIGTSTFTYGGARLIISTTTQSQLALQGGVADNIWKIRSIGSNFYLATSSATSQATTSTSALTILGSNGNVGIGTTTPGYLLSVSGTSGLMVTNTGASNTLYVEDAANDSTPFVIDSSGQVGIGTNAPLTTLYIQSSASNSGLTLTGNNAKEIDVISTDSSAVLLLQRFDTSKNAYIQYQNTGGSDQFGAGLSTDGTNNYYIGDGQLSTKYLTVVSGTGVVGIGTTTPYATSNLTLYEAGATAATSPQLVFSASTTVANAGFNKFMYNWAVGTDALDGGKFKISSSSVIGTNDRFVINGNGNVGIGTSTPFSTSNLTLYTAGATAATSPQLTFSASTTVASAGFNKFMYNWSVGTDALDGGKFKISSSSVIGTNDRFVIDGNGKVGIGTASPVSQLQIPNGTVQIGDGDGSNASKLVVANSGQVTGTFSAVVNHNTGDSFEASITAFMTGPDTVGAFHAAMYGNTNGDDYYALIGQRTRDSAWSDTPTALSSGDTLPGIAFAGQSGSSKSTDMEIGASIVGSVDGTVSAGVLPTAIRFNTSVTNNAGMTERMRIGSAGGVGIGTTTFAYGGARLIIASTTQAQIALQGGVADSIWKFRSIGSNFYISTSSATSQATTSISALEISSTGTTTVRGLNISAVATTTSNVGINITSGCYAFQGTCISGGTAGAAGPAGTGGSWATTTSTIAGELFNYSNNATDIVIIGGTSTTTGKFWFDPNSTQSSFRGQVGIGTSTFATAGAILTISTTTQSQLGLQGGNQDDIWKFRSIGSNFYISTSTALSTATSTLPAFAILNNGRVGIGTAVPSARLTLQSYNNGVNLFDTFGTAGVSLLNLSEYGGLTQNISSSTAFNILDGSGNSVFTIDTTAQTTNSGIDITAASGQTGNLFNIFSSNGTTGLVTVGPAGEFGIGTSTFLMSASRLTIASTTQPQLALQGGNQDPIWKIRSIGGNLYFATSSPTSIATSTPSFAILNNGRSGVGTSTPTAVFSVDASAYNNTNQTTSVPIFEVGSSTRTSLLVDAGGRVSMSLGAASAGGAALCTNLASATAPVNNIYYRIEDCTSAPGNDYAEMYPTENGTDYGDVMVMGTEIVDYLDDDGNSSPLPDAPRKHMTKLVKSSAPYQSNIVGIVSLNYNDFSSTGYNVISPSDNPMPVALNGRLPVKIASNSLPIQPGDYLTTSSEPGKAMKATRAGQVLGKAMEPWSPTSGKSTIIAFVNNTYYAGSFSNFGLSVSGNVQTSDELLSSFLDNPGSNSGNGSDNFSDLTADRVTASKEIITPKLTVHDITASTIYATTITSPTIDNITSRISALESGIASSSNIASINAKINSLENTINNHFDDQNNSFSTDGNVKLSNLPEAIGGESAVCISSDGEVRVNTGVSGCAISSLQDVTDVATSTPGLDLVRLLKPVSYKYNGQSDSHFGFIADDVDILAPELVAHTASGTPRAVRYDEMTSVLARSIQEIDVKITDIDTRLTHLEEMIASSTTANPNSAGLTFAQIIDEFQNQFETIGTKFSQGIAYFKSVFADNITVGSSSKPSGITIYDEVTNSPYCMKMRNGAMVSLSGTCESLATTTPITATTTPVGDITAPIITLFGNNPAQINYGTSYVDLGGSVTDTDENGVVNNNLGLHFSVDGIDMPDVFIDTSVSSSSPQATTTHTIIYSAMDAAGNIGTSTRIVNIIPQQ